MEEITEDYVSFEIAKLLKEKGFDIPCREHYYQYGELSLYSTEYNNWNGEDDYYSCPTLQIAMKWLREVHGISIDIITNFEWIRDSMASSTDIEYPEISEFTGYYFEIHQLVPHRLLYDSPVISKTYNKVCDKAIKYCLVNLI